MRQDTPLLQMECEASYGSVQKIGKRKMSNVYLSLSLAPDGLAVVGDDGRIGMEIQTERK